MVSWVGFLQKPARDKDSGAIVNLGGSPRKSPTVRQEREESHPVSS